MLTNSNTVLPSNQNSYPNNYANVQVTVHPSGKLLKELYSSARVDTVTLYFGT